MPAFMSHRSGCECYDCGRERLRRRNRLAGVTVLRPLKVTADAAETAGMSVRHLQSDAPVSAQAESDSVTAQAHRDAAIASALEEDFKTLTHIIDVYRRLFQIRNSTVFDDLEAESPAVRGRVEQARTNIRRGLDRLQGRA